MQYDNPPVVVNAIICRAGRVLLGIRGHEDGRYKLELIGGFVEIGETLEQALTREVMEETKIHCGPDVEYFGSFVGTYSDGRKLVSVVFKCPNTHESPAITDESLGFTWVDRVPENMFADCDAEALKRFFA